MGTQHVPPLGHSSTNLQMPGTTLYKFNFPTFECGKVCLCHSELPALDPQPQPVLGMRHSSRDGWGQAVHVRHLHRAGDQEQQHRCVHGDKRDSTIMCCTLRRPGAKTWLQKKGLS